MVGPSPVPAGRWLHVRLSRDRAPDMHQTLFLGNARVITVPGADVKHAAPVRPHACPSGRTAVGAHVGQGGDYAV